MWSGMAVMVLRGEERRMFVYNWRAAQSHCLRSLGATINFILTKESSVIVCGPALGTRCPSFVAAGPVA